MFFFLFSGQNLVPKQTFKVQEDYETTRTWKYSSWKSGSNSSNITDTTFPAINTPNFDLKKEKKTFVYTAVMCQSFMKIANT
jgi:hypothetical protein